MPSIFNKKQKAFRAPSQVGAITTVETAVCSSSGWVQHSNWTQEAEGVGPSNACSRWTHGGCPKPGTICVCLSRWQTTLPSSAAGIIQHSLLEGSGEDTEHSGLEWTSFSLSMLFSSQEKNTEPEASGKDRWPRGTKTSPSLTAPARLRVHLPVLSCGRLSHWHRRTGDLGQTWLANSCGLTSWWIRFWWLWRLRIVEVWGSSAMPENKDVWSVA